MQTLASGAIYILFEDGLIPANLVLISTRLLITFAVAFFFVPTDFDTLRIHECQT